MELLDVLIERNAPGTGMQADAAVQIFVHGKAPVVERRWRCWAAAERARRHGDVARAARWLSAAAEIQGDDEPSPLWKAENLVTHGRALRAAHEPAQALDHLKAGWANWKEVVGSYLFGRMVVETGIVGRWVAEMFEQLANDRDAIEPGSSEVATAWSSERMIHQVHEVGCEVIELAGAVGELASKRRYRVEGDASATR